MDLFLEVVKYPLIGVLGILTIYLVARVATWGVMRSIREYRKD